MATMREVAKQAGVSITTVSRVLNFNNLHGTSEDIQRRVWTAASALNYVLPDRKRKLANNVRHLNKLRIGCILNSNIDNFVDPFYQAVWEGARHELDKYDQSQTVMFDGSNTDSNAFLKSILNNHLDAIMIYNSVSDDLYKALVSKVKAIICVGDWLQWGEHDLVTYDHFEAVRLAIRHLVDRGHQQIGYIGGPELTSDRSGTMRLEARYRAYIEIMNTLGLPLHEPWIMNCHWSRKLCRKSILDLMETEHKPTALLVGSDNMAAVVLNALYEKHLRVPDDIAVVSISDLVFSLYTTPPLTTVRVPAEEMGRFAAQLIMSRLSGDNSLKKHHFFPVELVVRSST